MRGVLLSSLLSASVLGWFSGAGEDEHHTSIRLVGGGIPHKGNIMINGRPVCDDGFTLINAHVACRELGYGGALSFTNESAYGRTSPSFAMDDVRCDGSEKQLLDCQHSKTDNCDGGEAAGVVCDNSGDKNYSAISLEVSANMTTYEGEGNLMIYGRPVCDDGFTMMNAHVACWELGYRGALSFTTESRYGRTSSEFAMDNVRCYGTEARLLDCQHSKTDDCGGGEAAGVVCDTSTEDEQIEEEPMYDNCSLATPLYYTLRTSETYFKRFRNDVLRTSNREADYWMRRRESNDREFRFWSSFRHPVRDEFSYKAMIAEASKIFSMYTDIFHSYISSGDLTQAEEVGGMSYRYRYSPLSSIARAEKELDKFFTNLSEERNRKRYQYLMKNVLRLIKPDSWPYLAECLFEAFKENRGSSDLSKAITDLVSDDEFGKFNRYFKRYVGAISKSLKKALESEDTTEMVQLIYELTKSEIRSIDYTNLQPTLYYYVLKLKTVLMKPDFQELYTALNQTDYFIQESAWKLHTGRWPEMATFVENFLRRTIGSIVFWDRLTGQFLTEMKTEISEMMKEFRHILDDINIEDVADIMFDKLTSIMNMIADGEEASIRQLFQDIRGSGWERTISHLPEIIFDELSNFSLYICNYLPSYDDIKTAVVNNNFFQPIKTLLFKDWPQQEIYPASVEDFVRRIYDDRFSILDAVTGDSPCDHDD